MGEVAPLPTLPVDLDEDNLPAAQPTLDPAKSPVDAMMQTQRSARHRLVPFQPNHGEPIVNRPKPPLDVIKTFRKMQKKKRRAWLTESQTEPEPMETVNTTHATRPDFR
jgi:hypothetical protein